MRSDVGFGDFSGTSCVRFSKPNNCTLTRLVALHDVVEGELAHAQNLQAEVAHAGREEVEIHVVQ